MRDSLKTIFDNILGSLDNKKDIGFSARKLAAVTVILLVVVLHVKWFKSNHWEYTVEILVADFGFIVTCLGLTTYQSMKETAKTTTLEQKSTDDTNTTTLKQETT